MGAPGPKSLSGEEALGPQPEVIVAEHKTNHENLLGLLRALQ